MFSLYKNNQTKIMIFMIFLAVFFGIYFPHIFESIGFISIIFINLVKATILPIMFSSLVVTFAFIENIGKLRNVVFTSCIYIVLTEIIAVTIVIVTYHFIHFPVSHDMTVLLQSTNMTSVTGQDWHLQQIIEYIFPDNIIKTFVDFNVIPILVLSIVVGLSCGVDRQKSHHFVEFIVSMREVFLTLISGVMYLAPLAIFVLVGQAVATSYLKGMLATNLILLSKFVMIFLFTLGLQFIWQILLMLFTTRILQKYSFKEILRIAFPMATSAFITSSSLATLPIAMKVAKKLEAKNEVVDFMLPVCASMNFASGMMYEMAACLFFMQVLGIDMSLNQQILLGIMCIITGISVGGIPETGMISVISIFTIAHIPLAAIVILMPLDRILDRIRTVVNISGNTSGCLTVSKLLK